MGLILKKFDLNPFIEDNKKINEEIGTVLNQGKNYHNEIYNSFLNSKELYKEMLEKYENIGKIISTEFKDLKNKNITILNDTTGISSKIEKSYSIGIVSSLALTTIITGSLIFFLKKNENFKLQTKELISLTIDNLEQEIKNIKDINKDINNLYNIEKITNISNIPLIFITLAAIKF